MVLRYEQEENYNLEEETIMTTINTAAQHDSCRKEHNDMMMTMMQQQHPAPAAQQQEDDEQSSSRCTTTRLLPLRPQENRTNKIAIVACGCFWNPQYRFERVIGVKRVIVGYTGGGHTSPTFQQIQDHTKALFVEYDPTEVTYEQLLNVWVDNDDPWEHPDDNDVYGHRSALFVTNRKQRKEAYDFLSILASTKPNCQLYVDVEQAITFYQAEEYQQDYIQKQKEAAEMQLSLFFDDSAQSSLYAIME